MSVSFAIFTSHPNLLRCELHRLASQVDLSEGKPANAVGVGSYSQDQVLMQRYPTDRVLRSASDLWPRHDSEVLVYHACSLPVGMSLEENTQPFRFHRWLFSHMGILNEFVRVKARLVAFLPEILRRQMMGDTDSEHAFAVFLKHLREAGKLDDFSVDALTAGQLLGRTVRQLDQFASEAGAAKTSALNLVATNGSILGAVRHGDGPLYYTLLEGTSGCDICDIKPTTPDTNPKARAHKRIKTLAIASHLRRAQGWIELPKDAGVAVDTSLQVRTFSI